MGIALSIKLISAVWDSDLPAHLKPVASVLADKAYDDGTSVFPSVAYCAWLLSTNERTEQRHFAELRSLGVLRAVCHPECLDAPGTGHGRGQPITYRFVADSLPARAEWRRKGDKLPPFPNEKDDTSAERTTREPERASPAAPDPSFSDPSSDPREIDMGKRIGIERMLRESLGVLSPALDVIRYWAESFTMAEVEAAIGVAREKDARNTTYVTKVLESSKNKPKAVKVPPKPQFEYDEDALAAHEAAVRERTLARWAGKS